MTISAISIHLPWGRQDSHRTKGAVRAPKGSKLHLRQWTEETNVRSSDTGVPSGHEAEEGRTPPTHLRTHVCVHACRTPKCFHWELFYIFNLTNFWKKPVSASLKRCLKVTNMNRGLRSDPGRYICLALCIKGQPGPKGQEREGLQP
jgi:hypothetical protein